MGLESGSREYWNIKEHAERIYRAKCAARSTSELRELAKQGYQLMDRLREKYGYDDECVEYIIQTFYLDRE